MAQPRIQILKHGEVFAEFYIDSLPGSFNQQAFESRQAIIREQISIVKDKAKKVMRSLDGVQFCVIFPSKATPYEANSNQWRGALKATP
jgi:hypothetical protein